MGNGGELYADPKSSKELSEPVQNSGGRTEADDQRSGVLLSYQTQLRSLAFRLSNAEEHERHRLATQLHDNLGQILAMCKMELDLMKKENHGSGRTAGSMDHISDLLNEAIRYTRELMSDLKPPPSLEDGELGSILTWVAQKMEKHGLQVTIIEDDQHKPIDEKIRITLLQAVRELLFNIVKHAHVHEARIVVSRKKNQVEVIVEDKGIGFNPDEKKLPDHMDGGFGLFSLRERLELLGGSLKIISEVGKGTKAILTVPDGFQSENLMQPRPDAMQTSFAFAPSLQTKTDKNIRVLLVDDHTMFRSGLKAIITQQADMRVIGEASNGKQAIELTRKIYPDVVIMDVNMPEMNGIDATLQIKDFAPNIHIIGLSFHNEREVHQSILNAGASAYIKKSDVFETLCATIRSEA